MQSNATLSNAAVQDTSLRDLGPLAWVLDELRKSLESAFKALRRFVREADAARESDLPAVDTAQLRVARQQLHQAVGALEMVGLTEPALLLHAMEAVVQRFLQHPESCTKESALKIERASFALTEYLAGLLANRSISAVSLFPQYRELRELVRADRIHPADLWDFQWRWLPLTVGKTVPARDYSAEARTVVDLCVLQLMRGKAPQAARDMSELCLAFGAAHADLHGRTFWVIAAAVFEALAHDLLPADLYVKRVASRVLIQYTALSKGNLAVSERLVLDLLFFCAQAKPGSGEAANTLHSVRATYGLSQAHAVDYNAVQFGRFDPALLAQARRRIIVAKEMWSFLSAGDLSKSKAVTDQFSLVADSLIKLHAPSEPLAQALSHAVETALAAGKAPRSELAMEVATSVLYLEAAFEDLDPNDSQMTGRMANLAERLEKVRSGGKPEPLQGWMEDLYRKVSDKQTMGSVVGELRASLSELESSLDLFFRDPQNRAALVAVPRQMAQMRGVLSVLGLEQAALAVLRMRDTVEGMLTAEPAPTPAESAATAEQLGNSIGALSFLIDMLNYQPVLAKQLFVYDSDKGELKLLMGQAQKTSATAPDVAASTDVLSAEIRSLVQDADAGSERVELTQRLDQLATDAQLAEQPAMARTASEAAAALTDDQSMLSAQALTTLAASFAPDQLPAVSAAVATDLEEDDLQDIFLEEAREVVATGQDAVNSLVTEPENPAHLTVLRRAFHTLKGSGRMVGLFEFGEAAWACEQLLNSWLAEQKTADDKFIAFCAESLTQFAAWATDIEHNRAQSWSAQPLRASAEALRLGLSAVPLVAVLAAVPPSAPIDFSDIDFSIAVAADHTDVEVADIAQPLQAVSAAAENSASVAEFDSGSREELFEFELPTVPTAKAVLDLPELVLATFAVPAATLPDAAVEVAFSFDILPDDAAEGAAQAASQDDSLLSAGSAMREIPEAVQSDALRDLEFDADSADLIELSDSEFDAQFLADFELVDAPTATNEPADVALELVESPSVGAERSDQLAAGYDDAKAAAQAPRGELDSTAAPDHAFDNALAAAVPATAEPSDFAEDEQTKVIGSLRISIALYNMYLNEADEWSRRLVTEVAEWVMEPYQAIGESAAALAHSLAGTSATVGFFALSNMARALEAALERSRTHHAPNVALHGQVFIEATEDIRRLLHQFAAGFLKEPDHELLAQLKTLEFPDFLSQVDVDADAVDSVLGYGDIHAELPAGDSDLDQAFDQGSSNDRAMTSDSELSGDSERFFAGDDLTAPPTALPVPLVQPFLPPMSRNTDTQPGFELPLDVDDDIDAVDAIDFELFPIFEEEALELLPQLGGALRQWSARPDNQSARNEVLRGLHTLKGSARLAGALRLGEMAHRIESDIDYLGLRVSNSAELEPLLGRFDAMQSVFEALRHPVAVDEYFPATVERNTAAVSERLEASTAPPQLANAVDNRAEHNERATAGTDLAGGVVSPSARRIDIPAPQAMALQPLRQSSSATIRVRSQLLDRMVNQAGEVMITRSRLEAELGQLRSALGDMGGNLERLRQQLRDIEVQAESQMQSRLAQAKEVQAAFDPLEFDRFTRVQELTRMMAESVNDVATVQRTLQRTVDATEDDLVAQGRQARELQRDLLRTRMVEFESISDRLYRVVRQASKDTGKQVRLDLLGGTIEMDRGMLDRVTPAFEHILRNCVAHGIESPQARQAAGKDAAGLITVHLKQEGNDVSVDFSDDGNGLDLVRIRDKARGLGLIEHGQEIDDREAANLIFLPGFSTAQQVTELSGRGIGMDVVRSEVNALGGRIETLTTQGQGTHFKLVLPLTTAVTQVVMIRAGSLSVGVPANVVETVRRTSAAELAAAYRCGALTVAGEEVPFFWSGALLQASQQSGEVQTKTTPVVIFRSANQRVALHVDEVLGNREVVVKNLGPQLSRLPGLAGMSVLASGAVVLIYNPVAMVAVYGQQAISLTVMPFAVPTTAAGGSADNTSGVKPLATMPSAPQAPLILVVDDSITVRRVTQRLLQREGYRVVMAADGLQALERLLDERPSVVLSDIEMPRMDGFDLARNIRADARLAGLPIVMITSRIAEKHREHAMSLGVDHYLGKPYSEEELMGLVRQYCAAEALSAA